MKAIVRYIRDFSIVVAGIAVTLYVNYKVTNQDEKRDLRLYLNTIKMELEENIKVFDEVIEYMQPSIRYADYVRSHDKKSLNRDTLNVYVNVFSSSKSFTFNTNAFEMFKTSGIMRLVDDKDLLLSIWDVYTSINDLEEYLDLGFQTKYDEMKKLLALTKQGDVKDAPLRDFYTDSNMTYMMLQMSEETLKKSKEMVLKLEESKMTK